MNQIIENKFFSSTDLKNKTKNVLDTAEYLGEVFIMNNNKPKVVIVSIEQYNYMNNNRIEKVEPDEGEKKSINEYINSSNNDKGIEAKGFLKKLMK